MKYLLLICLIGLCFFNCQELSSSPEDISYWLIDWDFYNIEDSLLVENYTKFEMSISPSSHTLVDTGSMEQGNLYNFLTINDSESYVLKKLNLRTKVFLENLVIWDSTMAFKDLGFAKGKFQSGEEARNVSTLDFYITVPDTTE